MRIAIVTQFFVPKWLGGAEIAASRIAELLASRGHLVHVITSLDEGLPQASVSEGVFVHRIPWQRPNFFVARIIAARIFEFRKFFMLLKLRPEIVHVQMIQTGVIALFAKFFFHIPYVIYARGSDIYFSSSLPGTACVYKLLLKNANAVIALTKDMKQRIQQVYLRDVVVIPNGIDLQRFNGISKHGARKTLHLDAEQKIVTFAGSLREVKGVEFLIRATKIILETGAVVHVLIIGDGPDRAALEHLTHRLQISNYVVFEGQIQNDQIPYYLIASDIFVLPSLSEGFPNVLLEAMASGLPIIATNVRGIPEIIQDGENGFIIEPQNAKEIAENILMMLRSKDLMRRMSINNKLKARDFSWELVVDRLEEVYSSCL